MMSRDKWLAGAAAFALVASTGAAQAGGFALREQSTIGLGASFAGAAAGGAGLGSMFWNPATMTDFSGLQSSTSINYILPYSSITPDAAQSAVLSSVAGSAPTGDMGQDALLPASYYSWQLGEKFWVGLAINTPFGLVTQNPHNWTGQIYGRTSKVSSLSATPMMAYQVNDWISVGLGMQIMKFKVRLTQAVSPVANAGSAILEGEDTAVGFTAGATIKPMPGTEIGIGYRSRVNPKLDGTLFNSTSTFNIESDVKLPDQVTIGLRQQINEDLTLLAGWEWTHWGVFSRFPVTFKSSNAVATTLYFDYRDSWFTSLGAEYKWNRDLTLRAGLGFEKSPIKNDTRSVRLPDSDRIWTSIGATYQWNQKLSLDASYAHLFAKSGTINVVPGNPVYLGASFVGSTKSHVDIISVGLTYRWDDPKVAVPVIRPPLVTKG
jgi:long-chain fatty acid transport protein